MSTFPEARLPTTRTGKVTSPFRAVTVRTGRESASAQENRTNTPTSTARLQRDLDPGLAGTTRLQLNSYAEPVTLTVIIRPTQTTHKDPPIRRGWRRRIRVASFLNATVGRGLVVAPDLVMPVGEFSAAAPGAAA
jgi:hypothetical protein